MTNAPVDLATLFQAVTQSLAENQSQLNAADEYNHDHGDNMVEVFSTITKAIEAKPKATPEKQLSHAAKVLQRTGTSGSAALYGETLSAASKTVGSNGLTLENAMPFLQTLLGGSATQAAPQSPSKPQPKRPASKPKPPADDPLSTLLSGMENAQQLPQSGGGQQPTQPAGGDLLSTLLGGLTSGSEQPQQSSSGDMTGDLLSTLLGGMTAGQPQQQQQQQQPAGGDLLSTLLGGLTSGGEQQSAPQQSAGGGDLLSTLLTGMMSSGSGGSSQSQSDPSSELIGSLFSSLAGGGSSSNVQQQSSGMDIGDLIRIGLAYMQAKQQGKSTIEALVAAVLGNSRTGKQGYRKDSGELIAGTILQMLSGAGAR